MERVKKGKKYYTISIAVYDMIDNEWEIDKINFNRNNYFCTQEEAEAMVDKLHAVIEGADVIKMPRNEELEMIAELEYPTGTDDLLLHKGIKLAQIAFNSGVNWLKSKIVK